MDGENALYPDAIGDLPNREGRADPASTLGNANSLERLEPFLVTFTDTNVDAECVARSERGDVVTEPLFLGFDEGMHMALGAGGQPG
jgi:hypothetical protein